ncbi:MAG TPA: hypothetical protein ENN20_06445 [Candidatus Marinimicrobia bacterium]|nr:hypothetical protein [Candidatus Neomarinimicrobiota bacterium]
MRKYWIYAFQIVSILLLVFLVVSTFIPQVSEFPPGEYPGAANRLIRTLHLDRFYDSPVNVLLWGILALSMIAGIVLKGIRSPIQKILHLLLALCFIIIAVEKSSNRRFFMTIREDETVRLSDFTKSASATHDCELRLLQFEIQYHDNQRTPRAFLSQLLINERDTVQLAVNKPLAIGHYRLYQNAYDRKILFYLNINNQDYAAALGDTVICGAVECILADFDHAKRVFNIKVADNDYSIGMLQPLRIGDLELVIKPGKTVYSSIIEVAEVRWTKLLLVLALLYIIVLAVAFWRRK